MYNYINNNCFLLLIHNRYGSLLSSNCDITFGEILTVSENSND